MKNLLLLLFSICLISCGTSKFFRTSPQIIKGEWTLNSVSHNESEAYNITLLNDASKECFEGSTWQFTPNNNTGLYAITASNCATGNRNFIFTIQKVDENTNLYDFLLKPTNEKGKSITNSGFRLALTQLTETNMVWQQTVTVDGKPFTITMNFSK